MYNYQNSGASTPPPNGEGQCLANKASRNVIIGWVLVALNAELDTGYCDESNAWRLLRANERNT